MALGNGLGENILSLQNMLSLGNSFFFLQNISPGKVLGNNAPTRSLSQEPTLVLDQFCWVPRYKWELVFAIAQLSLRR